MAATYTLTIGTKNWSSWSLRAWLALRATGSPFDEDPIALRKTTTSQEVLERTPAGKVPVLRIRDASEDFLVWDSLAICETLAERHPEAKLLPADPRTRAEARSYACEMHSGFPDLRDQLSMDYARRLPTPVLRTETRQQIERIIAAWESALERYGEKGGFLFGEFSLADCMYAPVVSRFVTYGVALPTAAAAYRDRVFALADMREWSRMANEEVDKGVA
ncbi:MAG: glutathione S-transferase family protein [Alphaproteobacteria bacterium]|nr:glutathione S-transferase family protein [Alphaproteobacteria bacterium]